MSDYHGFAEHGDPNVPGNCRWCGRKLRHVRVTADDSQAGDPTYKIEGARWASVKATHAGSYQDDTFCGLRCGYQFGLRLAELGRRLVVPS